MRDVYCGGNRVVIPPQGRNAVLQELHEGHPGMCKMKGLARMYVWWPKIDANIEEAVRLCSTCQVNQSAPACSTPPSLEVAFASMDTSTHRLYGSIYG